MQIAILGPVELRTAEGDLVRVPGSRLRGLLVALALAAGYSVPKATLIDWLWGERPPADAANALQQLVSRLRRALPEGALTGHPEGYRLGVDPDAVDALRFERLLTAARADTDRAVDLLREALALWRGPAMQDVGLRDSAAFDAAIARLEGMRLGATEDRFDAEFGGVSGSGPLTALDPGHAAALIDELTDAVAAHPTRERLVAALMRALAATGRGNDALRLFDRTRQTLSEELGVDPSTDLSTLHVALLRGEIGRDRGDPDTGLRAELTTFIGKDADVAAVRALHADHRLITLIGPGGSGKTRLAVEVARTLVTGLPDGVRLVELAPLDDSADTDDVARTALAALGVREALLGQSSDAEPVDRVVAALRERSTTLVLDNCEHVIDAAAVFAHHVLGRCPRLRILATSREPLGVTGEALWPVTPLGLPGEHADAEEIAAAPAIRLLRDRAGAVRATLDTTPAALAASARVCRALDGMPLAIELAAARLRTMSLEQVADRLDDRFRLLTGGSRTAAARHRTLRAVIDWSWELLTDPERRVLRALSVFAGAASLEAAERICADDVVTPEEVLDLLTALTEKSLVLPEAGRQPRYRMLGTIREYAAHRLTEAGGSDRVRREHLRYFTELVEQAEPCLRTSAQLDALRTLAAEHDDITAAMRGALRAGEAHGALRLAAAAGWYWWLGGHRAEGSEFVTAAAMLPGDAPDETRAVVYALVVHFVSSGPQNDQFQAEEWIRKAFDLGAGVGGRHPVLSFLVPLERLLHGPEEILSAWETLSGDEDPWVRALGRLHVGRSRIQLGDGSPGADLALETALNDFRRIGDRWGISFAQTELANRLAVRGDLATACAHYEEAIALVSAFDAVEDTVPMRARQAQLYWLLGDPDASTVALDAARRAARRVAWPTVLAQLALAEADLARWRGDHEHAREESDRAVALLGEAAERAIIRAVRQDLLGYLARDTEMARTHRISAFAAVIETGYAPLIAQVLVGIADLATRCGENEQAVRLLGASARVLGLPDRSYPDVSRLTGITRERLGEDRFAELAHEGETTPWTTLAEAALRL